MPETITVDRTDGVLTVTLTRPERKNALSPEMAAELIELFGAVAFDPDVRVVVVTGAGDAFCSGADLSSVSTDDHGLVRMRSIHRVAQLLHDLPQPTIARINGVAAGAGLNIALGCDLTVASTDARFSVIFAQRGLSTDFGGAWLLPRLIGLHRAKELALLAEVLPASEAERLGLVNRVVPAEELDTVVGEWSARLAAGPPIALTQTKRMLNRAMEASWEAMLDAEGTAQTVNFGTADTAEAMRAFFEKRDPTFEGR
jgi:2-(1,2-epoxy-1,2-dihydrophenyl)acetyl-CoA isomerase